MAALLVRMPVVQVGIVRMRVHHRFVPVHMRVRLAIAPRKVVRVPVVRVVDVRVGVLDRLVLVQVLVALDEMQPDPERHQGGGDPEKL